MLTLEQFTQLPHDEVFAKGYVKNSYDAVHLTNHRLNEDLLWVAKKGGGDDWAIYVAWPEKGEDYTVNYGDKILTKEYILLLVPCDDEVLSRYRK